MEDGRHFENCYIAISQRKIISFRWNFVHSSRFWTGWTSRDQKWKSCIGQTPSSTERIFCFVILSLLEREVNFEQNLCNTFHNTFNMLPHYLAKDISSNVLISNPNMSKNCVTFEKNWNVCCQWSLEVSAFCLHTSRRRPSHCQWWSGQCHAKHAANAASVHNTYLHKIVCYL